MSVHCCSGARLRAYMYNPFAAISFSSIADESLQLSEEETILVRKLFFYARTPTPICYFAALYLASTRGAIAFYATAPDSTRHFIQRLEISFADYFFQAVEPCKQRLRRESHWAPYLRSGGLTPLQYCLLGANAHINGDISCSLINSFSEEEIRREAASFLQFENGLRPIYDALYELALSESRLVGYLHKLTHGRSREYGFGMLRRWRKRQVNLALLYYSRPVLYKWKKRLLRCRMWWLNRIIIGIL